MKRVAIIGLGLIGGSLGLALKGWADWERVGFARRVEVATKAVSSGAVDSAESDLVSAVKDASLVIIATPPMTVKDIVVQIWEHLRPGCVVTDTASTKAQIVTWAQELLPPWIHFIGGHPMAGKETSGIDAADAKLFHDGIYCLVSGKTSSPQAMELMQALVKQIGACPVVLGAAEHDKLVAGISHLPLLLSAALVSTTTKSPLWPQMAQLAAGGFRDLSRLASGSPEMSRDICLTNKGPLLQWLDEFTKELAEFRRLINNDYKELEQAFILARQRREEWLFGIPAEGV